MRIRLRGILAQIFVLNRMKVSTEGPPVCTGGTHRRIFHFLAALADVEYSSRSNSGQFQGQQGCSCLLRVFPKVSSKKSFSHWCRNHESKLRDLAEWQTPMIHAAVHSVAHLHRNPKCHLLLSVPWYGCLRPHTIHYFRKLCTYLNLLGKI